MIDRHLPGFNPRLVRIELEHVPTEGWIVSTLETDDPRFVQKSARVFYDICSWSEAVQIVADTLDGITPAGLEQEPF